MKKAKAEQTKKQKDKLVLDEQQSIGSYNNQFQNVSELYQQLKLKQKQNNKQQPLNKIQEDQQKILNNNFNTITQNNSQNKKLNINQINQTKIKLTQEQKQLLKSLSTKEMLQQRNKLIQQLQKINTNLSELIDQREKSYMELQVLKKQTSQNKIAYKQMTQQCRDYEFMLSGDYGIKLTEEIQHEKAYLKQLRKQLWQLNKQMKQPIESMIKQNQEKRKQQYDLQLFVMEQKTLLQQKKLKLQQIQRQSDIKKDKTNKLNYREKQLKKLIEMYFDEDYQTIMTKNPKNAQQSLQKLKAKKEKINKVILSQQSNNLKNYNRKLAQTRQMDRFLLQVQEAINQCSLKIIQIKHEKQNQKQKNSRFLQSRKNKQTRQTLSSDHYGNSKFNISKKIFSLPKFVQKRVVGRYPDNNPYGRKRIYTQLQNSNYFKNQNKQNQQKTNSNSNNDRTYHEQQRQSSNDRIKTDSNYGNKFRNPYQYQMNSNNNNNQTDLQAQKLQILKSLLNQQLVQKHKRIKDKKLSFIAQRNNPTLNSMKMNTEMHEQRYFETDGDHYRELCNQLGKQKLLIEQDQDIRQLIYEGIGLRRQK